MDRIRTSAEGQAVLAGSLVAFPLLDVLALLDKTRHAGELKVVCEGSDDHFVVDGGDLIDPTGGATGRLFELACSGDAWFTVTADNGHRPAGSRVALRTVIDHLAPRLSEWESLRRAVPLDATARMAPSTSLPEVHVRADQWKVLSRLGNGRRVGDVIDETGGSPVETLRVLRELSEAGLVSLGGPAAAALLPSRRTRGAGGAAGNGRTRSEPVDDEATPRPARQDRTTRPRDTGVVDVVDVIDPRVPASLMPPPVATRHWASAGSGRRS